MAERPASGAADVLELTSAEDEQPVEEKELILRAYLKRWKWEVGQFFGGVEAASARDELRRIAPAWGAQIRS